VISADDLAFYAKVSPVFAGKKEQVLPPTLCPDCRRQRRFAFRNERTLYHRKCDLSGKQIISNFAVDARNPVYAYEEWWSDKWDGRTYGREFDFSQPFFGQYSELQDCVPQLALSVWNSENSDYCNYVGHVKDSYLIFGSVYSQDCYYGSPYYSKDCVDTLVVRDCERCYECVDCRKLHSCFYCRDCHDCRDLLYCYDLQACHDCIGCAGLRQKQYCIFNTQYAREEYEAKRKELDLSQPKVHEHLRSKLQEISLKIPHRYMQSAQTERVSGNYVYQCRNVRDSYYADRSEDCRYCAQVVDLKDCYDNNYTEENELCCDYLGAYQDQRLLFSRFCNRVSDALYCDSCFGSKHLFGCIGLRNTEYCILNRQMTKEEYEATVPRIIEHLRETGEWGEFFPASISPFGYNETVAQEYFPLTEKEVLQRGWRWRPEESTRDKYLGPPIDLTKNADEFDDSLCQKILKCSVTGRPFKIIPQELKFYREMGLPIPHKCPDQRHKERMALRNPRKLWKRECSQCKKGIETTYAPERPEIVYCEECYLSIVY
jgi:hypothetical protein